MPTLAVDRDFLLDLGRLERQVQERVTDVFGKFESATHTGVHLEKIKNARNDRFRSIRIDQFWRGIVLTPVSGDTYTLLKVLPHDDAYDWAQRKNLSVNRATGGIEIRDDAAIEESREAAVVQAQQTPTRLFERVNDADMKRLGIDEQTLAFARALTDPIQLETAHAFLPSTQWEVLYGLAAGMTPDEVWSDLGAALVEEPIDENDLDSAVTRSKERVLVVSGPDELMAVLAYPIDLWRIYLHPSQRAIADASYRGPARVAGGPGTGKTVVALHRAKRLAEVGNGKVLVTTFTSTLADSLQTGINTLVEDPRTLSSIVVEHVDRIAHRVFREVHGAPAMLTAEQEKALWTEVLDKTGAQFTETFLGEEWREVVLAQEISSPDAYLGAKRAGRGRRLGADQRQTAWDAISAFEAALTEHASWTHETVRREATRELSSRSSKLYRHIVIDEAQDLTPDQWRLLRAAVAPDRDDIFIAGDTHQRIYDNRVSLRDVGIDIAGRSRRLTLNYRTTAEILAWSTKLMHGSGVDDMNGEVDTLSGSRSEMHGPSPIVRGFESAKEEQAFVAATVQQWLDDGMDASEIGIAVRSNRLGDDFDKALRAAQVSTRLLAKSTSRTDAVSIGTMHRMKGLEFRALAVVGVSAKYVPLGAAVASEEDDPQKHASDLLRERSLLFVACTRAREQLAVTWHGEPSQFLQL